MVKHVVFMKFKKDAVDSEIGEVEKGLAGLPAIISEIRGFEFGRDVVRSERSFDFALVSQFEDLEALDRYRVHPAHLAVVEKIKKVAETLLAVDFKF